MFRWFKNAVNFGVFRKIAIIIPMAALTFETQATIGQSYTKWQLDHTSKLVDIFVDDIKSDILGSYGQDDNGNTNASLIGSSTSVSVTPAWVDISAAAHTRKITITFGAATSPATTSAYLAGGIFEITFYKANCTDAINRNTDGSPGTALDGVCFKCTSVSNMPSTPFANCINPATLSDSIYFSTCPACSAA